MKQAVKDKKGLEIGYIFDGRFYVSVVNGLNEDDLQRISKAIKRTKEKAH